MATTTDSLPNLLVTSTFHCEQTIGLVTFPNAYPRKMTASEVVLKQNFSTSFKQLFQ